MIVIPQRRAGLLVRIDRFLLRSWSNPIVGITVAARRYVPPVQMDCGAHFGNIFASAGDIVIHGQAMMERQPVQPVDFDGTAAAGGDGRPGHASFESPQNAGRQIAVNFLPEFRNSNPVLLGFGVTSGRREHPSQRQWIGKRFQPHTTKRVRSGFVGLSSKMTGEQRPCASASETIQELSACKLHCYQGRQAENWLAKASSASLVEISAPAESSSCGSGLAVILRFAQGSGTSAND